MLDDKNYAAEDWKDPPNDKADNPSHDPCLPRTFTTLRNIILEFLVWTPLFWFKETFSFFVLVSHYDCNANNW